MRVGLEAIRHPEKSGFKTSAYKREINRRYTEAITGMRNDFTKTTRTWRTSVVFKVIGPEHRKSVTTDSQVYAYVNFGTRPHVIRARGKGLRFNTPYTAKTVPNVIGSGPGGSGANLVIVKQVMHPGFRGRNFSRAIYEKWREEYPDLLKLAIKDASR